MASDKSQWVERAKLAEQAERYEDMAKVRTWVLLDEQAFMGPNRLWVCCTGIVDKLEVENLTVTVCGFTTLPRGLK